MVNTKGSRAVSSLLSVNQALFLNASHGNFNYNLSVDRERANTLSQLRREPSFNILTIIPFFSSVGKTLDLQDLRTSGRSSFSGNSRSFDNQFRKEAIMPSGLATVEIFPPSLKLLVAADKEVFVNVPHRITCKFYCDIIYGSILP